MGHRLLWSEFVSGTEYGIPILQTQPKSAGVLPGDLQDSGIDFLCTAGHKGLYGPMGTGILIAKMESSCKPSSREEQERNLLLPAAHSHAGTFGKRYADLAGLSRYSICTDQTVKRIYLHEMKLIQTLYHGLKQMNGVKLYTQEPDMIKLCNCAFF